MKKTNSETTGTFEQRLDLLRASHASQFEIDAAVAVYERLRTARAICEAVAPDAFSESAMLSVLDALSDEVAGLQQLAFDADPPPERFAQ
jgi:hypothetical protein